MSIHVVQSSYKPKQKPLSKKKISQLEDECREYNKDRKRRNLHKEMMSLDEYINYKFGKKQSKTNREFGSLNLSKPATYRKTEIKRSESRSVGHLGKPKTQNYTGSLVKGVSQMHKSNLVPVISDDEINDIARMRR